MNTLKNHFYYCIDRMATVFAGLTFVFVSSISNEVFYVENDSSKAATDNFTCGIACLKNSDCGGFSYDPKQVCFVTH